MDELSLLMYSRHAFLPLLTGYVGSGEEDSLIHDATNVSHGQLKT